MIKTCPNCGKEFDAKFERYVCCSRSCATKLKWKQQSFIDKHKAYWDDEEKRTAHIAKFKEFQSSPEQRKRNSDAQKIAQNKPEVKAKIKEKNDAYWSIEENKIACTKRNIERWADPEYAHKMQSALHKYTDYILPSGRIVKLQGYEPQVLTELLKSYTEDDIVIGVKEINKELGRITYVQDNIEHTYLPDFYIRSENKVIEVKSVYTYELHKEKNELKKEACLVKGIRFEFIILDKDIEINLEKPKAKSLF